MHEMGLAIRIVDAVCSAAEGRRVKVVRVDVGDRVAVLPDALRFAFTLATEGTTAAGAALEIREVPARARCRACGAETTFDRPYGRCGCGAADLDWIAGGRADGARNGGGVMCATCGCGEGVVHEHGHGHEHEHVHEHVHEDEHVHEHDGAGRLVRLERAILGENDRVAALNRAFLRGRRVLALNLVSSPGSGKTTLLERTIRALEGSLPVTVVEGDQATDRDAERIRAAGARAVQVNTGAGCHLDAAMVARALDELDPEPSSALFIENVGNLVCPALFDLGEHAKVVVCSVTEGDDKPIKYPHMFRASALMLLNKMDLLPHVDFDVDRCVAHAREVNPEIEVIPISARTGEGLDAWIGWIRARTV